MKFYTAFLFDANSAEPHCTHKYLGTLTVEDLCEVVRIVRLFRPQDMYGPRLKFDRVKKWKHARPNPNCTRCGGSGQYNAAVDMTDIYFVSCGCGPQDIYRVLLPTAQKGFEEWKPVRDELKQFCMDEFSEYQPHITSLTETRIDKPFTHYGICSHGRVIFAWPLRLPGIIDALSW